jgi:AcrR family transcriptional regulator
VTRPQPEAEPKPPSKSERTRQAVLDAAARLFARNGYADTSLAQIADEVGIKAGSLYYHFDSKEELVYEVLRFGVTHSLEHTRAEVARLGARAPAAEQLRAAIQAHLDSLHELGDYASAGLKIVEQAPRPIRRRQYANQRRYGEYWHDLLARAQAAGVLPAGVDLLTARLLLFGAMNSTVAWPEGAQRSTGLTTRCSRCWRAASSAARSRSSPAAAPASAAPPRSRSRARARTS